MKCKSLIKGLSVKVKGSKEVVITGLSADSKSVSPGNLFIAKRGKMHDGTRFIPQAVQNGAVAVLTDLYDPFIPCTQILTEDILKTEALLAAKFYQNPAKKLFMVGITGTNGKTTTSYFIQHLLEQKGISTGMLGTVEYILGKSRLPAIRTTPDIITVQKYLHEMVEGNLEAAVLEASSHALDQGRLNGTHFDAAIFTNLTPEHLDYHQTMEKYFLAKEKLFKEHIKKKGIAILNADDPYSEKVRSQEKVWTYGIENEADVRAKNLSYSLEGTEFEVVAQGQTAFFRSPLAGSFNVHNLLAGITLGLTKGFSLEEMVPIVASFQGAPGRLERAGKKVFVDYAHTEDALMKTLHILRKIAPAKIITVFGCGGDRDREKRSKMGEASEKLSDYSILTSDNPRSEDPEVICREILKGFKTDRYYLEPDRYKAIEKAIEIASPEDIVLIAGKGHEKTQIFARKTVAFDDVEIAKELQCT